MFYPYIRTVLKHALKYLAILLSVALLFPAAADTYHGIQHQDEFHCTSSDIHLHEQIHHCNICDYIAPLTVKPHNAPFEVILSESAVIRNGFQRIEVEMKDIFVRPVRGPPFSC
jgi:hypothetical protein